MNNEEKTSCEVNKQNPTDETVSIQDEDGQAQIQLLSDNAQGLTRCETVGNAKEQQRYMAGIPQLKTYEEISSKIPQRHEGFVNFENQVNDNKQPQVSRESIADETVRLLKRQLVLMNLILAGDQTKFASSHTAVQGQESLATATGDVGVGQIDGLSLPQNVYSQPNKQLSILIHKALETLKASNAQAFDSIQCDVKDLCIAQQLEAGSAFQDQIKHIPQNQSAQKIENVAQDVMRDSSKNHQEDLVVSIPLPQQTLPIDQTLQKRNEVNQNKIECALDENKAPEKQEKLSGQPMDFKMTLRSRKQTDYKEVQTSSDQYCSKADLSKDAAIEQQTFLVERSNKNPPIKSLGKQENNLSDKKLEKREQLIISISDQNSEKKRNDKFLSPKPSQDAKGYFLTENKNDVDQNEFKKEKNDSLTVSEHLESIFKNRVQREKSTLADSNRKHHTLEDFLDTQNPNDIVSFQPCSSKTFKGIPKEWHQTIKVRNPDTQRIKLYFKCMYPNCNSVFKKSCNLRDHFRKHTGQRPFTCDYCNKTFTQSGNLGRHLKNVHQKQRRQHHDDNRTAVSNKLHNSDDTEYDEEEDSEVHSLHQKSHSDCHVDEEAQKNPKLGKRITSMNHLNISDHLKEYNQSKRRRSSVNADMVQNSDKNDSMAVLRQRLMDIKAKDAVLKHQAASIFPSQKYLQPQMGAATAAHYHHPLYHQQFSQHQQHHQLTQSVPQTNYPLMQYLYQQHLQPPRFIPKLNPDVKQTPPQHQQQNNDNKLKILSGLLKTILENKKKNE